MRVAAAAALASAVSVSAIVNPFGNKFDISKITGGPVKTESGWNFIDCGLPTDIVQIESLTVSPDPPVPGKNLTITASGFVSETIVDGAYADITVKLGLIKLLSKRFDLCEEAAKNNAEIQCPVEAGEHTIVQEIALPKEIPPGKFVVMVRAYSKDDEDLLCADIQADFRKKPF